VSWFDRMKKLQFLREWITEDQAYQKQLTQYNSRA